MNFNRSILAVIILVSGIMITFTGCKDDDSNNIVSSDGIEYHNVDACLITEDGNVTNCDAVKASENLKASSSIEQKSAAAEKATTATLGTNYLYYLARILPPKVDGNYVQSNMVLLSTNGKKAFIAYNTAGDTFRGAIQIVNVDALSLLLGITTEYKFSDMDINSIYLDGDTLFFGASQNPDNNSDFAMTFVGHISISNPESLATVKANMVRLNLNDDLAALSPRGSYAVTSITGTNSSYFISVGAYPGGILKVSKTLVNNKLDIANAVFTQYSDVRSMTSFNTNLYALQGTDLGDGNTAAANGNVLLNNGSSWTPYSISDFGPAGYKATIDLYKDPSKNENGLIFLGLSANGLKVMSMADSDGALTQIASISNPALSAASIAEGYLANTNSASYDSDFIFSANGNYGFRVFKNSNNGSNKITNPNFQIVGYHNMQGLTYGGVEYSANDSAYRNQVLLVAAGEGGVCVYLLLTK